MREILIALINQRWLDGLDEFNMWAISTFIRDHYTSAIIDPDTGIMYNARSSDITTVLNKCTDEELIACFEGQCCQKYR